MRAQDGPPLRAIVECPELLAGSVIGHLGTGTNGYIITHIKPPVHRQSATFTLCYNWQLWEGNLIGGYGQSVAGNSQ